MKADRKDDLKNAWRIVTGGEAWPFETEFRFDEFRRWRFDWAHRDTMLAIEVDGVTAWGKTIGRHQSAAGFEADCEKFNAATMLGWRVLRFTQRQIKSDPIGVVSTIKLTMGIPSKFSGPEKRP